MSEGNPVVFDYGVIRCRSVGDVLSGVGEPLSYDVLLDAVAADGRMLLQARGGSGKTTTLTRLGERAAELGFAVAKLDALKWAGTQVEGQPFLSRSVVAATAPTLPISELASGSRFLLLVDGLNEIGQSFASGLLAALDQLAAMYPTLSIVVSDRLVRRDVDLESWILATLSLVSKEQVSSLTGGRDLRDDLPSLRLPYYLDRALSGDQAASRSEQHRTYLLLHGGVDEARLPDLARAAFDQYQFQKSRTLDLPRLGREAGEELLEALIESGAVVVEPTPRFAHHLVHDYLAARHLAENPDRWNSKSLDVLTFKASSMDALAMVLEMAPSEADLLVRMVYDWNFYGAAYLIAEDRQGGSKVSRAMEFAVVTMLGERRFDLFSSTARQVTDALQVLGTEYANTMLSVDSRDQLRDLAADAVPGFESNPWFEVWAELYARPSSRGLSEADLEVLEGRDSLLGWTMSNVMRRGSLESEIAESLRATAAENSSQVVRWRAVHVLGSNPEPETVKILLARIDHDDATWVRYGSIRSLIEIALARQDLRGPVIDALSERAELLLADAPLAREIERVLVVANPPIGWSEDTTRLVEELWAASDSVEQQDRWRGLGASVRGSHGVMV